MSHRDKHRHKSRHRPHAVKPASLQKPQQTVPQAPAQPPDHDTNPLTSAALVTGQSELTVTGE